MIGLFSLCSFVVICYGRSSFCFISLRNWDCFGVVQRGRVLPWSALQSCTFLRNQSHLFSFLQLSQIREKAPEKQTAGSGVKFTIVGWFNYTVKIVMLSIEEAP